MSSFQTLGSLWLLELSAQEKRHKLAWQSPGRQFVCVCVLVVDV